MNQKNDAFTFFGKMLTFSRLHLQSNDLTLINAQLKHTIDNKNSQIPVVIDSDVSQDLPALVDILWQWGLQPIGVVGGNLSEQAKTLRLAIFPDDGKRIARVETQAKSQKTQKNSKTDIKPAADIQNIGTQDTPSQADAMDLSNDNTHLTDATFNQVKVVTQILRSGQRIEHLGGDLIITNSVNDGAEAITDSNLHVYGRGLGRLVAGATGDKNAKIFCQNFNPSLVSVAGTWQLRDDIPKDYLDKAVQVSYQEGHGIVYTLMDSAVTSHKN
ncbi:septum site-determining protein MinC [Moraxella lincolnii]|uniref:Probable septum site-determining protein MinC n=1 Tax=Lwoffella lincolnii TaxID=90241 RepID=A0A1T0CES1_9GAMM|nr:septum site-determining protein MinC [Moraxella lincolnii]OOS20793.1 septum site-determining protein MinC [Moraxella lincolnii]